MGQCLGERFYLAHHLAFSPRSPVREGGDPVTYAQLAPEHQAAWNRAAVHFTARLSGVDTERDAIVETCAQAAEAQDRIGREWVRDSLWAQILKRAGDNVRALKRRDGRA